MNIRRTTIGNAQVRTVRLTPGSGWAYDHPVKFETMVYGGPLDYTFDRYRTEEQALDGHLEMVKRVNKAMFPSDATGE